MKTQILFRTLLAIVFACFSFQYSFSQTSDLEHEMEKEIALWNQDCPFLMDEQFNLCVVKWSSLQKGIYMHIAFYINSSAPYKMSYSQAKEAKKVMKEAYIDLLSANPAMRKFIIEDDGKFIYRFHNYDVTSISSFDKEKFNSDFHDYFDIVITKNDLKKRKR